MSNQELVFDNGILSDDRLEQQASLARAIENFSKGYLAANIMIIIQRLVYFLADHNYHNYPRIQIDSAWLIGNISTKNPEAVVSAIPCLADLLESSTKDSVRCQVLQALKLISGDGLNRRNMLDHYNALELVMEVIYSKRNEDTDIFKAASATLTKLYCAEPSVEFKEVSPAVEILLLSKDAQVLNNTLLMLLYLSQKEFGGVQICGFGFEKKLVEMLHHPSPIVVSSALRVMVNLVVQQTQLVVTCDALSRISNVLTRNYENNNNDIKVLVCRTISNIPAGTQERTQRVIDADLIPKLVNLASAEDADFIIKENVVRVILNRTTGASHDQIRYFVEHNSIHFLCDMLLCQHTRTIIQCLNGLFNILRAGEDAKPVGGVNTYKQITEDAEGVERISNLQMDDSLEVYQGALRIVESFWECDKCGIQGCGTPGGCM